MIHYLAPGGDASRPAFKPETRTETPGISVHPFSGIGPENEVTDDDERGKARQTILDPEVLGPKNFPSNSKRLRCLSSLPEKGWFLRSARKNRMTLEVFGLCA